VKGKAKIEGSNNHQKNFDKFMKGKRNSKNKKNKTKRQGKGKDKAMPQVWWPKPLCKEMSNSPTLG
jgi:hypothetical protein